MAQIPSFQDCIQLPFMNVEVAEVLEGGAKEENSEDVQKERYFPCRGEQRYLPVSFRCNHLPDCLHGEDEHNCSKCPY